MKRLNKLYIGTNTKMYKTISGTEEYLRRLDSLTKDIPQDEMNLFVIPSYTTLFSAVKAVEGSRIAVGAQNMCPEDEGAFTGEISPIMLRETGVKLVMAGHSERRHILGETDFDEEKKIAKICEYNFIPLLCVGETRTEKEYNIGSEVLRTQLKIGLHSISAVQAERLLVAYEPVWSIGENGIPADKNYADEMHRVIKDTLIELFGEETGSDIPVLYGGSVNAQNSLEYIDMPNIDGLFIGRSAWDADNFNKIIRDVLTAFKSKRECSV